MSTALDPNTLQFPFADYFQIKGDGDIIKSGITAAVIYTKIHSFCTNIILGVSYTIELTEQTAQGFDTLHNKEIGIYLGRSNRTIKLLVNNKLFELYVQDVEQ